MRCMLWALLFLWGSAWATPQSAQRAAEVLSQALEASASLNVEQEAPQGRQLQVGQPLELRLSADRNGYVTLIRIDAHGVLELADLTLSPAGGYLNTRTPQFLTPENVPEVLTARPPVGDAHIFVLFTPTPLDKAALGLDALSRHAMVDADRALSIAEQLAREVREDGSVLGKHIALQVTGSLGERDYTPQEIVQYFTQTTRSIQRPRLDMYVNFEFGSDSVVPESMSRVDTWGRVLSDPLMAGQRFVIAGHTDDVGSDEHNMALSLRRATAIRDLLVSRYNIDPSRLEVKGFGKTRPLTSGTSEQERAANRRVDFERISAP